MNIIAEIGSVHDGSFGNACKLIDLAAECGANSVKFQTHISEAETLKDAPNPGYFNDESRFEYFKRTSFSLDQWKQLKSNSLKNGLNFLSSPFSISAIELLEKVPIDTYKVPSGEVTNHALLENLAKIGKPVFLSSGMSTWMELDNAVNILKDNVDLTVMQCTSAYPCPYERVGINILDQMRDRYPKPIRIGFSDHTSGISAGLIAAYQGADVIEKHLTFSRAMYGSDASNSLEPSEFKNYINLIHEACLMRERPVDKDDLADLEEMKLVFEKSIVSSRKLKKGSLINFKDLVFKKPGNGIKASNYKNLIGRSLTRDVPFNHQFKVEDFQ